MRSKYQAQDQVMGRCGPAEGEEAGLQRNQGRALGRGRPETMQPQRDQMLGGFLVAASLGLYFLLFIFVSFP